MLRIRRLIAGFGAAVLGLVISAAAHAGPFYDNGVSPVLTGGVGTIYAQYNNQLVADDFLVPDGVTTLTDVNWSGRYASPVPASDSFTIRLFSDSAGKPALTALSTQTVAATRIPSAVYTGTYLYSATLTPISLTAGNRYWISLFNETEENWLWLMMVGDGGNSKYSDDISDGLTGWYDDPNVDYKMDFALSSTAAASVPLPVTWPLFGAGLFAVGFMARRRKSQSLMAA